MERQYGPKEGGAGVKPEKLGFSLLVRSTASYPEDQK